MCLFFISAHRSIEFLFLGPALLAILLLRGTGEEGAVPYIALALAWGPQAITAIFDLFFWTVEPKLPEAN